MAEQHSAVTAIRDSISEGFVASTLYSQGWNIHFRALDFDSLLAHLQNQDSRNSILLISTDCEGLTQTGLNEIRGLVLKVLVIHTTYENKSSFTDAQPLPATPLELMSLMRGSLRSPMVRPHLLARAEKKSKIIAIGGVSGGVGCTTLALNLAYELSALEKRVLILDSHINSPALAALLGQRGLHNESEFRVISQYFSAGEISQGNVNRVIDNLSRAMIEYDFIIVDLGITCDLAATLSGRRWSGQLMMWVSNFADALWVMAPSDRVGLNRLRAFSAELMINAMKPTLTFIRVLRYQSKRADASSESFLKIVTPLRPSRIIEFPYDPRSVHKAEVEEDSLLESNERGIVRKMIAEIAGELIS